MSAALEWLLQRLSADRGRLTIERRAQLLRLQFPWNEFPARDYLLRVACPELLLPAKLVHRFSPFALVADLLAELPFCKDLQRKAPGRVLSLYLRLEAEPPTPAQWLWLDPRSPLYAFDLGERVETLELRSAGPAAPLLAIRLLGDAPTAPQLGAPGPAAVAAAASAVPPEPPRPRSVWLEVDPERRVAEAAAAAVARLPGKRGEGERLLLLTNDGGLWLLPDLPLRAYGPQPGDLLALCAMPLLQLVPAREADAALAPKPRPSLPLLLPLDTLVSEAVPRLLAWLEESCAAPPRAAEHGLCVLDLDEREGDGGERLVTWLEPALPLAFYYSSALRADRLLHLLPLAPAAPRSPPRSSASIQLSSPAQVSPPRRPLATRHGWAMRVSFRQPPGDGPQMPAAADPQGAATEAVAALSTGSSAGPFPAAQLAARGAAPASQQQQQPLLSGPAVPSASGGAGPLAMPTRARAPSVSAGPSSPPAPSPPPPLPPPTLSVFGAGTPAVRPAEPGGGSSASNSSPGGAGGGNSALRQALAALTCIGGESLHGALGGMEVSLAEGWAAGAEVEDDAVLLVTNYRSLFVFHPPGAADAATPAGPPGRPDLDLPHHAVARMSKVGAAAAEVESKHCFTFRVRFRSAASGPAQRKAWMACWRDAVLQPPYALRCAPAADSSAAREPDNAQVLAEEFARLAARSPARSWRLSEVNRDWSLCATYPRVLAVPAALADEQLRPIAAFRSKGRLPVLTYVHTNGAPLLRSAQPKPGIARWRCAEDERLLELAASASGGRGGAVMHLYDARPRMHAMANAALGAGVENAAHYPQLAQIAFLNVPNIHVMRDSYQRLMAALAQAYDWGPDSGGWLALVDKTDWLAHLKLLLHGAARVAASLHRDAVATLVHCSDGWDRTSQLVSLALLMLDPFYRTLRGFQVLVEKDWLSFGHKFHVRCGHASVPSSGPSSATAAAPAATPAAAASGAQGSSGAGSQGAGDEGRAPIFLQLIDCTHQLMAQFPCAFEFNEAYLLALLDALYSCRFGTFLFGCERERADLGAHRAASLWAHLRERAGDYASPFYVPTEVIVPDVRCCSLRLWTAYFMRQRKTRQEGDHLGLEERGRQLKSSCESLYRQLQEAEKELRRLRRQSHPQAHGQGQGQGQQAPAPAQAQGAKKAV